MTCTECREELELWVGMAALPNDLAVHLKSCSECRAHWEELRGLSDTVADDRLFEVTPEERASILKGVASRTKAEPQTTITSLHWLRYAAVAASVLIVAGIGITGYRAQWFGGHTSATDTIVIAQVDSQTQLGMKTDEPIVLDEEDYSIMETAIDSTMSLDDASMLENLSDEQIQYLEAHLDVRGLI